VNSDAGAIRNPPSTFRNRYDHAAHEPARRVLRWLITHIGWRFLARIDHARIAGLEHLPRTGPALLMINHIAFLDPVVVLGNVPRNVVPLAKAEVHRLPVWGVFTRLWDVIPVHRDEMDRRAVERALAVLAAGEVVLIAPEATRHQALAAGKVGVAYLGHKSGAPIIPVAVEHTTGYPTLVGPWNRGKPGAGRLPRERLRLMTDEALYVLAALLPEHRRGHYRDLSQATTETIELL
jgi:1-acyl-sn-glycerol-3-phosphate acyltransferase